MLKSVEYTQLSGRGRHVSTWKRFGDKELSHSMTHYLQAIASLAGGKGFARVADIAAQLGVSQSGVSSMLRTLGSRGYVNHQRYGYVELTPRGAELAARTEANRRILTQFLADTLGVSQALAAEDACMIEHLVSPEVMVALLDLDTFMRSDAPEAHAFRDAWAARSGGCPGVAPTGSGLCRSTCIRTVLVPEPARTEGAAP
jgi:Mn-dependent DtxR family transcriptional regulator